MRVLLLAQFYPPVIGGEERHVRNLAVGLAGVGHEVHVATLRVGDGFGTPIEDDGVTVHRLDHLGGRFPAVYGAADRPLSFPFPDPLTTRDLARLAHEVRPDVVHAHNWIVNSWVPLPVAKRTPLVLSLHDNSHVCATKRLMFEGAPCPGPTPSRCLPCTRDHYGGAKGPAIYAAVQAGRPLRNRRVDRFTPVSTFVGRASGLDAAAVPWEVVPNFVPDELLDLEPLRAPELPDGDFLFYAGDLSREKGVHTLLAAYDALPADRPPMLLVGRQVDDLDVPAGARIEHNWPHDRVLSAYRHCLAAAVPSELPDSCPTTVLEALAMGAPLITTHEGGIADMVVDEQSALVVRRGDVAGLGRALERLVGDADLRKRLTVAGRTAVRPFLRSTVVARLDALYAELTAS